MRVILIHFPQAYTKREYNNIVYTNLGICPQQYTAAENWVDVRSIIVVAALKEAESKLCQCQHAVQEREKSFSWQNATTLSLNVLAHSFVVTHCSVTRVYLEIKRRSTDVALIEKTTLECIQVPRLEFPPGQIEPGSQQLLKYTYDVNSINFIELAL